MSLPRVLFSTLIVPAVLILAVPTFLAGARFDFLGSMTNSWIRMLALIPFAAAIVLVLVGIWETLRALPSEAWPHPGGLHRRVRNPIWLGVFLAVAAQYWLWDWPPIIAYLIILFVVMDCVLRYAVEPRLVDRYGASYTAYIDAVPRWIPRLDPSRVYRG